MGSGTDQVRTQTRSSGVAFWGFGSVVLVVPEPVVTGLLDRMSLVALTGGELEWLLWWVVVVFHSMAGF